MNIGDKVKIVYDGRLKEGLKGLEGIVTEIKLIRAHPYGYFMVKAKISENKEVYLPIDCFQII